MSKSTTSLSNEDFAARMRAKRGVLSSGKRTRRSPMRAQPLQPPAVKELESGTVACCSSQQLLSKQGVLAKLFECRSCRAIQYDPNQCWDDKYRGKGRTQLLLEYAVQTARVGTAVAVYFVAHDRRYAEVLSNRVCDWCQEEGKFFKGRERDQVYFHNGGRIFFISFDQLQGRGFRAGSSDLIIYDHFQSVHKR